MESIFFDSLFFLFGIPVVYIAVAVVCMINQRVRERFEERPEKGGRE